MTAHDQRGRRQVRMRLPGPAVTVGCLAGLAWLLAGQHGQLGRQPEAVVARGLTRLGGVRFRRSDWAVAAGMASLNWLGDAACLVLSLTAARLAVPLHDVLLVWSAGVAASVLYLTPGGVGIVDVALVAALAGLRVPTADAVTGVLIYRLISLWLVLLTGWILLFLIGSRRPGQALMRAEHPPPARQDFARDLHDDPQEEKRCLT